MDLPRSNDGEARFSVYVEELTSVIGHADRAKPLRDYCLGLMMPCERKSVERWQRSQHQNGPRPSISRFFILSAREDGRTRRFSRRCCDSACKKDPLFGVIGFQSGPRNRGSTLASMILGSRGWDAGRGDDCKDPPRVF